MTQVKYSLVILIRFHQIFNLGIDHQESLHEFGQWREGEVIVGSIRNHTLVELKTTPRNVPTQGNHFKQVFSRNEQKDFLWLFSLPSHHALGGACSHTTMSYHLRHKRTGREEDMVCLLQALRGVCECVCRPWRALGEGSILCLCLQHAPELWNAWERGMSIRGGG